jgi:hypothetical protein
MNIIIHCKIIKIMLKKSKELQDQIKLYGGLFVD